MNDVPVRLGPLALLLAVISICVTVLGILTYATSRADVNLAEKYAQTVRARYSLEKSAQEWAGGFIASDSAPDGETPDEDGVYRREFTDGEGMILHAGVRIGRDGRAVVAEWRYASSTSASVTVTVCFGAESPLYCPSVTSG